MKTIFKKNKHNKDGPAENVADINLQNITKKINGDKKSEEKKAFIAWPENKQPAVENGIVEIIEGRTKNGGYVAYPKEAVKNESKP